MSDWQDIETAPFKLDSDGAKWIGKSLFGKQRAWGWSQWVGQLDAGDIWLVDLGNGSYDETDVPTHWMALPEPPK